MFLKVNTPDGVQVTMYFAFVGSSMGVHIEVTSKYASITEGLCGNNNIDQGDEVTKQNKVTTFDQTDRWR